MWSEAMTTIYLSTTLAQVLSHEVSNAEGQWTGATRFLKVTQFVVSRENDALSVLSLCQPQHVSRQCHLV